MYSLSTVLKNDLNVNRNATIRSNFPHEKQAFAYISYIIEHLLSLQNEYNKK